MAAEKLKALILGERRLPISKWTDDKAWADQFIPEIKHILGEWLVGEPPQAEDALHNTDLMVLKMEPMRIGCRIRKPHQYTERYAREFTIRSTRPNGTKTELAKIIEGWGDYFFYGFGDDTTCRLLCWHLANLKAFRLWFMSQLVHRQGQMPGTEIPNKDDSSTFRVFRWAELPTDFIVAHDMLMPPTATSAFTPTT